MLACVKRVPPLARLSMFGVGRPRDPKALTWSARSVSIEMRMIGGEVAAAAAYDRIAAAAAIENNRMPSEYRYYQCILSANWMSRAANVLVICPNKAPFANVLLGLPKFV